MQERFDLDEVAEAYFSAPTPDRPEYARLLIRARGRAMFPLLRAMLAIVARERNSTDHLARVGRYSALGEEGARWMWAKITMEPLVQAAYDVVRRIGQPAKTELCRALFERDYKMRLAAALLLSMDESPSEETLREIQGAIRYIGPDEKQGTVLALLGLALYRGGDSKGKAIIEASSGDMGINSEDWIERVVNTALIELQKHK